MSAIAVRVAAAAVSNRLDRVVVDIWSLVLERRASARWGVDRIFGFAVSI